MKLQESYGCKLIWVFFKNFNYNKKEVLINCWTFFPKYVFVHKFSMVIKYFELEKIYIKYFELQNINIIKVLLDDDFSLKEVLENGNDFCFRN